MVSTQRTSRIIIGVSIAISAVVIGMVLVTAIAHAMISRRAMYRISSLEVRSMLDDVTGIYNRRYFGQRLVESLARVRRFKMSSAMLVVRVSNLAEAGGTDGVNFVMKKIAEQIKEGNRVYDVQARLGEKDFGVLLHEVDVEKAQIVAGRLRKLMDTEVVMPGRKKEKGWRRLWPRRLVHPGTRTFQPSSVVAGVVYEGNVTDVNQIIEQAESLIETTKSDSPIQITLLQIKPLLYL